MELRPSGRRPKSNLRLDGAAAAVFAIDPKGGIMSSNHLFKKKMLGTVVLVTAITVLAGLVVTGCGSNGTVEAGQGSSVSGALVNTIVVSGTGRVTTLPDEATIQVSVENDGATAAAALDANSKDTQKVLDRLKQEGIADKDIETANVVVYPKYEYDRDSGKESPAGYRAQNTVTVTFDDLTLIGNVYAAMTEAGADSIYGPSWQLSDDNAAVATALTKAIANARSKAEVIAQDQGVGLGEALIISESSAGSHYPVYDTVARAEDEGAGSVTPPPITPQEIEVSASVTVTYEMK